MLPTIIKHIVYYPTLAYNGLMTKISSRKWYNRIDDTVILGALPVKWISKKLIEEENIGGILSLNEEYEMKLLMYTMEEWEKLNVTQFKIPTLDYIGAPSTSDLKKGVDFIRQKQTENKSVYVHCKAGRTRSTTMVTCYLMQIKQWSSKDVLDFIREKRPHIILREPQQKAIKSYEELYVNSSR